MRPVLLLSLLVVGTAAVAKPKAKPAAKQPAQPAAAPSPAPAAAAAQPAPSRSSTQLLARATAAYASLEYDAVIPLTDVLLQRDDLALDEKLEAHRLNGSAKAIVQDPLEAERPFRLLLRLRPDYELPPATPPKILAAFRKVQTEERALSQQADNYRREQVVKQLTLLDGPPEKARGGRALPFVFRLRDPGANVETVSVPYRRAGQPSFSVMALERNEDGTWRGTLPAEFTADPTGFALEYYVETADAKGPLLKRGSSAAPLRIDIGAGALDTKPPPVKRGVFFTGLGATLVAAAATGAMAITTVVLQGQYVALQSGGVVEGAQLVAIGSRGSAVALGTNIGLGVTALFAVITALLIPFVDWNPGD